MKLFWIGTLFVIFLLTGSLNCDKEDYDSDFAEFEDFDTDDDFVKVTSERNEADRRANSADSTGGRAAAGNDGFPSEDADDDGVVEDEDSEFDHFADEEEFEGFNKESATPPVFDQKTGEPKLTVAKVPLHFRYVLSPIHFPNALTLY